MSEIFEKVTKILQGAEAVMGLLGYEEQESAYTAQLILELSARGLSVVRKPFVVFGKDNIPNHVKWIDLVVDGEIAVEIKNTTMPDKMNDKQLMALLDLSDLPAAVAINFTEDHLMERSRVIIKKTPENRAGETKAISDKSRAAESSETNSSEIKLSEPKSTETKPSESKTDESET